MKFLIKIFSLVLLIIVAAACSGEDPDFVTSTVVQDIEQISNVKIIFNEGNKESRVTTKFIKDRWEKSLKEEGHNVDLKSFEIIEGFDSNKNEVIYFLRTTSSDNTIQTGAFITKGSNGVYRMGSKQCTCEGCPQGCQLEINGTSCTCSSCEGNSNKACTKKETIIIDTGIH